MLNLLIEHLEWDSRFFGFKIGRIFMSKESQKFINNSESISNDYDLVYIYSKDELILENKKNHLVDKKVTLCLEIPKVKTIVEGISKYNSDQLTDELISLACAAGKYSRFNTDPFFPTELFIKLYTEWIEKSISNKYSNIVFVSKHKGNIIGFATLSINNLVASIGLISVDERFQEKGIGKNLILSCINYLIDKNISILEVVTQFHNQIAMNFYKKMNFKIKDITNIYHFWPKK